MLVPRKVAEATTPGVPGQNTTLLPRLGGIRPLFGRAKCGGKDHVNTRTGGCGGGGGVSSLAGSQSPGLDMCSSECGKAAGWNRYASVLCLKASTAGCKSPCMRDVPMPKLHL